MGRIEDIRNNCEVSKEHIKRMDEQKLGFHIMSFQRDYVNDVSHLLSKLEIAEKALKRISTKFPGSNLNELVQHKERIAEEALEQIQKE